MASKKSMQVTIPATQAHRQFGDLMRRVYGGKEHFLIERDGFPVAVMLSIQEYQELMQEQQSREERIQQFQKIARSIGEAAERQGLSEEDVLEALENTQHDIYQEYYGDDQA